MRVARRFAPLARLPRPAQWGALLIASVVMTWLLEIAGLPAALFLGAMIAAILVVTAGGSLRVPRPPFYAAQAVLGCMIARVITSDIIHTFLKDWPLFLGMVVAVIAAATLIGWVLSRYQIMPGTTGIWGLSPGAASVMMLMAGAYGADIQLVAFMQYLRVVFVAIAASLIARFVVHVHGSATAAIIWFPQIHALPFAETLALALIGGVVGRLSRIPAGVLLFPMFVGTFLHGAGWISIELPPWLLAISYAFLGWSIGSGFTPEILVSAARTLPQTVLSILALMLFCGGLAFVLVRTAGIEPLTAYLATSPGGMDSAAIIAASSKVDLPFVVALQTARFMTVLLIGPSISRFVADRIGPAKPSPVKSDAATQELIAHVKQDEDELD